MKKFLAIFICVVCFGTNLKVLAQSSYSAESINVFNAGISFHKQGKYELAQQKYLQALKLQPNFTEAKKNLALSYQNLGYDSFQKQDYEKAIIYYKKALELEPSNMSACRNLALSYNAIGDYENASNLYKQILTFDNKDNLSMHYLAQIYLKTNQFDKAQDLYNKILALTPNDSAAKTNLEFATYHHKEKIINENINNLSISQKAPSSIYKLIKPNNGITPQTIEKMQKMIDLTWSDPTGRMMLQGIVTQKVPINLTQGTLNANAERSKETRTFMLYGFIPVGSFTTSHLAINLPFNYISDFYNQSESSYHRIYCLQVFIHEVGHAYMNIKNPHNVDSIEEEIGVSMIGYNIANKLITGNYLTPQESETYGLNCLESALKDDHRNLQIFSGFNSTAQFYGLNLPHPETYSNLIIMYKKLLSEGKTTPVPNFYRYTK